MEFIPLVVIAAVGVSGHRHRGAGQSLERESTGCAGSRSASPRSNAASPALRSQRAGGATVRGPAAGTDTTRHRSRGRKTSRRNSATRPKRRSRPHRRKLRRACRRRRPPAPPSAPARQPSLEERFGTRWVVWVGGLALALGGFFLVKYTIEAGLIGPGVRIFFGALLAAGLVVGGEWLRRKESASRYCRRTGGEYPEHPDRGRHRGRLCHRLGRL